jgi:deoxycytidylate deaminase
MEIAKHIERLAYNEAKKSTHRFRLGAVIARGNKILGVGFNKGNKTHPISNHPYSSIHAETDAVIDLDVEDLPKKTTLYVCRIKKNGTYGLASPCEFCRRLITTKRITRIAYTNLTGEWVFENLE